MPNTFIYTGDPTSFMSLPSDDQDFVIQKLSEDFSPEEIHYMLKNEQSSYVQLETVREFCQQEEVQERVELAEQVREKKAANIDRQELVSDLKDIKEELKKQISKLREQDQNDISNDTMKNLISNIKLMGEFIGELRQNESSENTGTVNVNKLEQNFNIQQTVEYMPAEEKKGLAEQLADDPDVEDFVLVEQE